MLTCSQKSTLLWALKSHAPLGFQLTRRARSHVARSSFVAVCQNIPRKGVPASTTSWTPFGWELNPKYDSTFIKVGKYRAHYLAAGTSETVILILASQVVTARSYRSTLNALSRTYRVICLELPGCGRSDCVKTPFTQQQSADWLAQFLKQMDIDSAVVIGHSCSGAPAIVLAQTHSKLVSHLVLVGSIGVVHHLSCFFMTSLSCTLSTCSLECCPGGHAPRALAKVVIGRVHDGLLELQYSIPGIFHGLYNVLFQAQNFWYWVRMSSTLDITPEAANVHVPTLLSWGKHDHTCPLPAARRFAEVMPASQLYVSEHGLHNWLIERPEEFADSVSSFIASTESTAKSNEQPRFV